ncbi:hypothetical protein [Streptomyces sp. NPDC102360]|uniref:hypothetical protein n=1 Tax=Streptomyces sp. NPDC102360 TaxID=3366160 RepID=UPI0038260755
MLLRLAYLTVTNLFSALRLLPMSDRDKDAESRTRRRTSLRIEWTVGGRPGFLGRRVRA